MNSPQPLPRHQVLLESLNYDSILYIVEDCEDIGNTCIGGDDVISFRMW